jgi:hypothetical protein
MSTNTAYQLSVATQKILVDYNSSRYLSFDIHSVRQRYEKIDKAIQLESTTRRDKIKDYYDDTEISLVEPPVTSITSFLTDLYLSTPTIFQAVSKKKEGKEAVQMMNAIIEENVNASGTTREMARFFRDCVKYDVGGIVVEWEAEQVSTVTTQVDAAASKSAAAVNVNRREGNKMSHLDMYNTWYDTIVDASQVHRNGEFIGSVKRVSMVELARMVENFKLSGSNGTANNSPVMNEDKMWGLSSNNSNQHYIPTVKPSLEHSKQSNGFSDFFGKPTSADSAKGFIDSNGYEVVTLFARIIPSMFGITSKLVPGADKLQIWKFVFVGWDTLIYAEKQTNAHNYLPAILAQINEDGIRAQAKSVAEKNIPLQNLSTKLYDARIAGLKRALSDRAIYMEGVIQKKDIDSENPAAKIPMRPNVFTKDTRAAYTSIPYNDNMGATFLQEINFLKRQGEETSGVNRPQQGQFQKGNKTAAEFNETMGNADSNTRVMALLLESQAIQPMKTIVKTNILQYQDFGVTITGTDGEEVEVDTQKLREANLNFKLADGLRTKSQLVDQQLLERFMQLLMTVPEMQAKYDVSDLIDYMMGLGGLDIAQFERDLAAAGLPPANPAAPAPTA